MVVVINILLDVAKLVRELALAVVGELLAMVLGGYLLGTMEKVRTSLVQLKVDFKEGMLTHRLWVEHERNHVNCFDCEFWHVRYFYLYATKGEILKYGAYLALRNRQAYLGSQSVVDF